MATRTDGRKSLLGDFGEVWGTCLGGLGEGFQNMLVIFVVGFGHLCWNMFRKCLEGKDL